MNTTLHHVDGILDGLNHREPLLVYIALNTCPYCLRFDDEWQAGVRDAQNLNGLTTCTIRLDRNDEFQLAKKMFDIQTVPALRLLFNGTVHRFPDGVQRTNERIDKWTMPLIERLIVDCARRAIVTKSRGATSLLHVRNVLFVVMMAHDEEMNESCVRLNRHFQHDLTAVRRVRVTTSHHADDASLKMHALPAYVYVDELGRAFTRQGRTRHERIIEWVYRHTYYPLSIQDKSSCGIFE